jgi:Bifunctional DNA primase/polymerase, N-terminal
MPENKEALLCQEQGQSNKSTPILAHALGYAKKGRPVFPCTGKVPLTANGFKDASLDERIIRGWWGRYPDANIAIPTGERSGFYVVDIDGEAGFQSLQELEAIHGSLPPTITGETGKGQHFYFKYPTGAKMGNTAGVLGKCIDTRGHGGYILAPPSVHPDTGKVYKFIKTPPIADLPGWIIELVQKQEYESRAIVPVGIVTDKQKRYAQMALRKACDDIQSAPEGERNNTLNIQALGIAGLVAAGALGHYEARGCLIDAALHCGLSEREAKLTVESAFRKGLTQPRDLTDIGVQPQKAWGLRYA